MASRLNVKTKIRSAVSQDRSRFRDGEYDLDLTYITSDVIAMAMPADGLEATWRNHIEDVAGMLTKYHLQQFLIINLSEKAYNYSKFANQILECVFHQNHSSLLFSSHFNYSLKKDMDFLIILIHPWHY